MDNGTVFGADVVIGEVRSRGFACGVGSLLRRASRFVKFCLVAVFSFFAMGVFATEFEYMNWGDGIQLTGIKDAIPKKLVIPAEYGGKKVTSVWLNFGFMDDSPEIQEVIISEGVEEVGAFEDILTLRRVEIPASVTRIYEGAFTGSRAVLGEGPAGLHGIETFSVAEGNARYKLKNGLLIEDGRKVVLCLPSVMATVIPEGVTGIGSRAFSGCSDLVSIEFPSTLSGVGYGSSDSEMFYGCVSLKQIDLSRTTITEIPSYAFKSCYSLEEVRFPATLTKIGGFAFAYCDALKAVYFEGDAPTVKADYIDEEEERFPEGDIYVMGAKSTRGTYGKYVSSDSAYNSYFLLTRRLPNVATYVNQDSSGWGRIPGVWQGCPVRSLDEAPKSVYVKVVDDVGGKVTGLDSVLYDVGSKLTLKAVAEKGYVFAGWSFSGLIDDFLDPNLSFTLNSAVSNPVNIWAKFIPVSEDWAQIRWNTEADVIECESGAQMDPLSFTVDSGSIAVAKVTGLPAGLKFTAKPIVVRDAVTGEDVVYPKNTIYGTPTKSGVYTVVANVTTAGGKTDASSRTLVVRREGEMKLVVMCDANMGTASGSGIYAAGKKTTLKATAKKGYVFAGWYTDESFDTPLEADVDYRTPSMQYEMGTEDMTIYARFEPVEEDAGISLGGEFLDFDLYWDDDSSELALEVESLSLPTVKVAGLPAGLKYDAKTMTISGKPTKPGVYAVKVAMSNATVKNVVEEFRIVVPNLVSEKIYGLESSSDFYRFVSGVSMDDSAIMPSAEDGYTLKVSGLPSGMKYDAKTGKVTGVPTKSGTYTVTVTGTKKGEPTETATITVTVDGMPEAVAGTYIGHIDDGNMAGSFTLTATAAGKLTAKIVTVQGTASFSASSWTSVDGSYDGYFDERVFFATMEDAKSGRTLEVSINANGNMNEGTYRDENGDEFTVDAAKNMFSSKWHFMVFEGDGGTWGMCRVPTAADAEVTVTLKDGMATVSGQIGGFKVSGSTVVRVGGEMLSVRLPAFVTVGGKKRIIDIYMSSDEGYATLVGEEH